ncbi:hypothetical protein F5883DRAFT_59030 [Diaporthe sp. PMI_573]|nr:hypothetical protein F5883DRAFT_59030 [Diaporthaceae sp. PMI_573]
MPWIVFKRSMILFESLTFLRLLSSGENRRDSPSGRSHLATVLKCYVCPLPACPGSQIGSRLAQCRHASLLRLYDSGAYRLLATRCPLRPPLTQR